MNRGMVLLGLFLVGGTIYRLRAIESRKRGEQRWDNSDIRKARHSAGPREHLKEKRSVTVFLAIGLVTFGWGLIDLDGEILALVIWALVGLGIAWSYATYGVASSS